MTLIEVSISDRILLLDVELDGAQGPEAQGTAAAPPAAAAATGTGASTPGPCSVAQLASQALLEFQTAFPEEPPSKVRFVRDAEGRILSGALLLRSVHLGDGIGRLTVDLVDAASNGNRVLMTDDICEQYMRWQVHTARRARDCLLQIADAGSAQRLRTGGVAKPSADFLALLRDLRSARWEDAQMLVVEALSAVLEYFRQPHLIRFAVQELQCLLRDSEHESVIVASFRKIAHSRTAYRHIDKGLLVKTMNKALNLMTKVQIEQESLDLFDYLEEVAAPASGAPSSTGAIDINNFDERSMSHGQYIEQLLKWLVSDELKHRHFALQKVIRLVWAHASERTERAIPLSDFQWFQITETGLSCLKLSLRPSSTKLKVERPSQRRGASSLPAVRAVESVRAMQVARAALTSEDSDVVSAQLILHMLSMIGCIQPSIIRSVLLNIDVSFCKLLTTLCHSEDMPGVGYAKSSWHFDIAELTKQKCLFSINGYSKNPISVGNMSIADCCSFLLLLTMRKSDAPRPWESGPLDDSAAYIGSLAMDPQMPPESSNKWRGGAEDFDVSRSAPWSSRIAVETQALLLFLGAQTYCPRVLFAMVYVLHQVTIRVDQRVEVQGNASIYSAAGTLSRHSNTEEALDPAVVRWLTSNRPDSPRLTKSDAEAEAFSNDDELLSRNQNNDVTLIRCVRRWMFAGRRLPGAIALQILALVSSAVEVQVFLMDRRVLPKVIFSEVHMMDFNSL